MIPLPRHDIAFDLGVSVNPDRTITTPTRQITASPLIRTRPDWPETTASSPANGALDRCNRNRPASP